MDRTTKGILLLLALGLWFHGLALLTRPVAAQGVADQTLADVATYTKQIAQNTAPIASGFNALVLEAQLARRRR